MVKKHFLNILRWSLRFHGIFHIGHVYTDIVVGNWAGVVIGTYIITVELLASFLLPNEHVHLKPGISDVHEKCE